MVEEWLKRAKSNLERARNGKSSEDILYEDLCFDCQQVVEKAFKALLMEKGILFPRTHSVGLLLDLLDKAEVTVPAEIKQSAILTDYAVTTRYPGDYEAVTKEEYSEALDLANRVFSWVVQERLKNE